MTSPATGAVTLRILGADTDDGPIVFAMPHNAAAAARTCNSRNLTSKSASENTIRFDCYDAAGTAITTAFQFVVMD